MASYIDCRKQKFSLSYKNKKFIYRVFSTWTKQYLRKITYTDRSCPSPWKEPRCTTVILFPLRYLLKRIDLYYKHYT